MGKVGCSLGPPIFRAPKKSLKITVRVFDIKGPKKIWQSKYLELYWYFTHRGAPVMTLA